MNDEDRQKELNEFMGLVNSLCKKYEVQFSISITDLRTIKKQEDALQVGGSKSVDAHPQTPDSKEMGSGNDGGKVNEASDAQEKEKEVVKGEVA